MGQGVEYRQHGDLYFVSGATAIGQYLARQIPLVLTGPQPRYEKVYAVDEEQTDHTVSGPIGLDGLYRKGDLAGWLEGVPLVDAAKGTWQDDHTFVIERLEIGLGQPPEQWTLTFNGNKLSVSFKFADRPEITADGETGG